MIKISIQDELGTLDLNQAAAPCFSVCSSPLASTSIPQPGLQIESWRASVVKDRDDREIGSAHQPVMGRVRAWTSYDGGISKRLALNKDNVSSSG